MQIITGVVLKPGYERKNMESVEQVSDINGEHEVITLITVKPTRKALYFIRWKEFEALHLAKLDRRRLKTARQKFRGDKGGWFKVIQNNQPELILEDEVPKRCYINEAIDFVCILDTDTRKIYKLRMEDLVRDAIIALQQPVKYSEDLKSHYEGKYKVIKGLSYEDAKCFNLRKMWSVFSGGSIKGYTLSPVISRERSHISGLDIDALDYEYLKANGIIREDIRFRTTCYQAEYPIVLNYDEVGVICSFRKYGNDIKIRLDENKRKILGQNYIYNAGTIKRVDFKDISDI